MICQPYVALHRPYFLPGTLLMALLLLVGCAGGNASDSQRIAAAAVQAAQAEADVAAAAISMGAAVAGHFDAFDQAQVRCSAVSEALPMLGTSLPSLGDGPAAMRAREELQRVEGLSREWLRACEVIVRAREEMAAMHDAASDFQAGLPPLQAFLDEAARQLIKTADSSTQVYFVVRQMLLLERMRGGARRVLAGGPSAVTDADRLSRGHALFDRMLGALIHGNPELAIAPVEDPLALDPLKEVGERFAGINASVTVLLEGSTGLFETREALATQGLAQEELSNALRELSRQLLAIP